MLLLQCESSGFRLKTIDIVIRNTKDAEDTLRSYETRLRDVSKVPAKEEEVEAHRSQLKVMFETVAAVACSPAGRPGDVFVLV